MRLFRRHKERKEAAERWEKLGEELQNNVDKCDARTLER